MLYSTTHILQLFLIQFIRTTKLMLKLIELIVSIPYDDYCASTFKLKNNQSRRNDGTLTLTPVAVHRHPQWHL